MLLFTLRRMLVSVVLLTATSFIVFALLHLAPGSPEEVLTGGRPVAESTLEAIRAQHHLDEPFLSQYGHWAVGVLQGDMGDSITAQQPVREAISERLPVTLQLGAFATVLVVIGGVAIGTIAAVKRGKPADTVLLSAMVGFAAIPPYVTGMLLILVFSVNLGWFPVFGAGFGIVDRLHHLVLPAIALSLALSALVARATRSSLGEALDGEYVEAGRAAGFSETRVVGKHALRNAAGPILTVGGITAGYLITGGVLVEVTFGLPGLGSLLVEAVQAKDFAIGQAITLVFTAVFIIVTFLVDVACAAVDPRLSLGKQATA